MKRRLCAAAAAMLGALVIAAAGATVASAHVTVDPSSLPKGTSDVILTFRVPNESTTASVVGLRVQFPLAHPIVLVNPEAGSGWQVNVTKSTLPKPITTDDGTFTSITSEIDWSGAGIPVGQFGEFNVLAQGIPSDTDQLVFKAIQTYSDGSVVSWIQVPTKAVPDPPTPPRPSRSLRPAAPLPRRRPRRPRRPPRPRPAPVARVATRSPSRRSCSVASPCWWRCSPSGWAAHASAATTRARGIRRPESSATAAPRAAPAQLFEPVCSGWAR